MAVLLIFFLEPVTPLFTIFVKRKTQVQIDTFLLNRIMVQEFLIASTHTCDVKIESDV